MSTTVLIPNNPAEADPRTRDHIQKVALILNDLLRSGRIDLGSDGTYTTPAGGGDVLRVLDADSTVGANHSRVVAGPYEVGAFVLTIESGATLYVH